MIGHWKTDAVNLPVFTYTGPLPATALRRDGQKAKLPPDPWFLLGNQQLTLFTHVSGEMELISGQRTWARLNASESMNRGMNHAKVTVNGKSVPLVGMGSVSSDPARCERSFGCGWARYSYWLENCEITRTLAVQPSDTIGGGESAWVTTVEIRNTSDHSLEIAYDESILAHFVQIQMQFTPEAQRQVQYTYEEHSGAIGAWIGILARVDDPLLKLSPEDQSPVECFPPCLYMTPAGGTVLTVAADRTLSAHFTEEIPAGETLTFSWITGFSFGEVPDPAAMKNALKGIDADHTFTNEWKSFLPDFPDEKDPALRREMVWNAYVLEAMATWSSYYHETKIPQGTVYDYQWGQHASARDNLQHALPCVYYHPQLAKSVLRYILKRTTAFGEIRLIEYGVGCADNGSYFTSDQQLFFFLLLSEYLRVTKDYAFLLESVPCYPGKGSGEFTVLEHVRHCFEMLRDVIGTGPHGLVRMCNSDWNDTVFYILRVQYNRAFFTGESLMNSAMVCSIFPVFIRELEQAADAVRNPLLDPLIHSMDLYRRNILSAFLRDLGDRSFPRRMYFDGQAYGEENMFLESMGYMLQIPELPPERRRAMYDEMIRRVYPGEKLGPREQEAPGEFDDPIYEKGSRENGGFWWALNGPIITALTDLDRNEAKKRLEQMTFRHYAEAFPDYWTSYWSASDNIESSLIPEEGLADQSEEYWCQPVFCAHPHAWSLYCYERLREKSGIDSGSFANKKR